MDRTGAQPWLMLKKSALVKRMLLAAFITAGVLAALAGVWLLRTHGDEGRIWMNRGLDWVRGVGPGTFFGLMAVLPGLGCPLMIFTLSAGPVFGPVMGLPMVIALASLSLGINLSLTYWLARWVLRPWIERLCSWLGYTLPQVAAEDRLGLLVLVRVTPGPPYALQNFVLGLTAIPFGLYMAVSFVIVSLYSAAFILFGDALVHGRGKTALLAVSLFIAFSVGVKFLRRHYQRRQAKTS